MLSDSDLDFAEDPSQPSWIGDHDQEVAKVFHSHPTLEPAITAGNEALVAGALADSRLDSPDPVTPEAVHVIFRSARKETKDRPAVPAGPGAPRKGEFALGLAGRLREARDTGSSVAVPDHLRDLFNFLYPGPVGVSLPQRADIAAQAPDAGLMESEAPAQ